MVKKAFATIVIIAASCFVFLWLWDVYGSSYTILHNGTNVDDDPAQVKGGLALAGMFVMAATVSLGLVAIWVPSRPE